MPSQSEDPKKSSRRLFEYFAKNPGTWVLSAERLKKAADSLRQSCWPLEREWHDTKAAAADFITGPVYMMLIGFAVENVLKAMIITQQPGTVEKQKLSKVICTHDLKTLWDHVGLRHCGEYDRLLTRLHTFVVSFGRYPVTTNKRDMDTKLHASFHSNPDFQQVERLWDFLCGRLRERCPDIPLQA